jgi:uncharacterized protein YbgA (DUF1722 family)/uncharacterized protein YbbK (DUF523 family)
LKEQSEKIRIGISTCLLGEKVRYDAGHKRHAYINEIFGQYFEFVPVCPEVEIGMGTPREAVRLEGLFQSPRMVGNKTGKDWTVKMNRYAVARVKKRDLADISGYILKSRSPSCGMERVKLFHNSLSERKGVGLYARKLLESFPHLPIEEEGRLSDSHLRENFVVRIFGYYRLQQLFGEKFSRKAVIDFHSKEKFLLMAHSVVHYRSLGKLVAAIAQISPSAFRDEYIAGFMEALRCKATVRKNVNVLQHIFGFMKTKFDSAEKADILSVVEEYHRGVVPLIVPITLLRHYINKFDIEYIRDQTYLNPHPRELMLRNHV